MALEQYTEADDNQMVLAGNQSLNQEELLQEGDTMMEIDDALDDINQVTHVESLAQEIQVIQSEYRILTRRQMATMSKQQQKDYIAEGLD